MKKNQVNQDSSNPPQIFSLSHTHKTQKYKNSTIYLTRANQIPAESGTEVMKDSVAVGLSHLGMDVVAGVTQIGDLLGQQFYSLGRVAEDDALVDL